MIKISMIFQITLFISVSGFITGCGSLTGIPSHGGGKRFAIEQELVAASARAAIKELDLIDIQGKKVNLFVNAIGDLGTGNLIGGRLSVVSQLRGDYIQSPTQNEKYTYPRYTSSTVQEASNSSSTNAFGLTESSAKSTAQSFTNDNSESESTQQTSQNSKTVGSSYVKSSTESMSISPSSKEVQQKGGGGEIQLGYEYKGLGSYLGSTEIVSEDLQYLTALLQTYLYLNGVWVVPPSEAELDLYVTVDVFGTVRTRVDWFLANNEILRAKTSLEVMAVDQLTGQLIMPPQVAGSVAEYNEQYILWAGPVVIKTYLKHGNPLLTDYTEISPTKTITMPVEQTLAVPYPFQHQFEKENDVQELESE